jgi:hypothetical protein
MSLSFVHLDAEHWSTSETGRSVARRRYVHAAARTMLEQGLDLIARGIDVDGGVIAHAGRSRTAFYETFRGHDSRRQLVDALVGEVLDPARSTTTNELRDQLTDVVAPSAACDAEALIHRYATDQFHEVLDDDIARLQLAVWALGQCDDEVAGRFREIYGVWVGEVADGVEAILRGHRLALRDPFTPALLATVLTALIEGLVVRARVDPDAVPMTLFADTVCALVRSVTTPV